MDPDLMTRPERPVNLNRPRLRRKQASEYLDKVWAIQQSPSTLATKASRGGGPEFQYDGPFPTYTPDALDRYALRRLGEPRTSTSKAFGTKAIQQSERGRAGAAVAQPEQDQTAIRSSPLPANAPFPSRAPARETVHDVE
jgi:hypothetical protein